MEIERHEDASDPLSRCIILSIKKKSNSRQANEHWFLRRFRIDIDFDNV